MKLKLQLKTVVTIKDDLDSLINEYEENIIKHNDDMNVDVLLDTLFKLQDQLIIVKEVIQNANKAKNSESKTNNFFIYKKSNLEKFKKFLIRLSKTKGVRDNTGHLNKANVEEKRKTVESEIKRIQGKLTKFNDSKKVFVEFDKTLKSMFPVLQ